ncbi:MAG: excinuclease ABC subunit UvrC, partial [Alphaproteobacteria bacterium]|nr:excinuclease ABC subunit UvrC [Alphaproteobacteria bacterium]
MTDNVSPPAFEAGTEIIREAARTLPDTPGVYRMLDAHGDALYVGKARALKSRVISYTRTAALPERIRRMVSLTRAMEFVHTHTEVEALLLEATLIKKLKPAYNILLRDDKSFPYILITGDHDFPLLTRHRGAKKRKGDYYGPFAEAGSVNRTIALLQRVFLLRNCADTVFRNRTRPCLQYHIKRCTAPCVGLVSKDEYAAQTAQARAFLEGKSRALQKTMAEAMQTASVAQDYETAALYRDRLRALSAVQAVQGIKAEDLRDADVIALARGHGRSCVQVFFFRGGQSYGNRPYFPRHAPEDPSEKILATFTAQFYENKPVPAEILLSGAVDEQALLAEALSLKADKMVRLSVPVRGKRRKIVEFAQRNAEMALELEVAQRAGEKGLRENLAVLLGMEEAPVRIEVYDNSHTAGDKMVGGMIVAGPDGFQKNAYRKFNIREAGASDDYGMMREVLERRFKRA